MKILIIFLAFIMILTIISCKSNTGVKPVIYGKVDFYGQEYIFTTIECSVAGTVGGPPQFILSIRLENEQERGILFEIQEIDNNPSKLLTLGEHFATGQRDRINNTISGYSNSIGRINGEQLSVVWEEIEVAEHTFSGRGFIHIKQRLEHICADSIWANGEFSYPGDPEYDNYYATQCEPGYYYPEQKIWFRCKDSSHWLKDLNISNN